MNVYRRRRGSMITLVAACAVFLMIVGVGLFLLMKVLGGGREVANTTDANTLLVAKKELFMPVAKGSGPDGAMFGGCDFSDCKYPTNAPGISLLSYNLCVGKALLIAIRANEAQVAGSDVSKWFVAVKDIGTKLTDSMNAAEASTFNQNGLFNNERMFGNYAPTFDHGSTRCMKPGAATNIYFPQSVLANANFTIPLTSSPSGPTGTFLRSLPPDGTGTTIQSTGYLQGYKNITVPGVGTISGAPIFPQQKPHLVSLTDYLSSKADLGYNDAPPNAFECHAKSKDVSSGTFGGATACSIVGAVMNASDSTPGSGGSNYPFGSGFEMVPALSYGYIDFSNWAANQQPPGYDPNNMETNIFNQELGNGNTVYAASEAGQNSNLTAFSAFPSSGNSSTMTNWLSWAGTTVGGPTNGSPPAGSFYCCTTGAVPLQQYGSSNPPTGQALKQLQAIANGMKGRNEQPQDCWQQLQSDALGLGGSCLAAFGSMQATFGHDQPKTTLPNNAQEFSQVDWAKAALCVAFQGSKTPINGVTMTPAATSSTSPTAYYNTVDVNLTVGQPCSGLGAYKWWVQNGQGQKLPNPAPYMQSPNPFVMPLEDASQSTPYNLIMQTQGSSCAQNTINSLVKAAQMIQPAASLSTVLKLLKNNPIPMGPRGGGSGDAGAYHMYMYLPGGKLTEQLILSNAKPPKFSGKDPDGPTPSSTCYQNTYAIDGTIVDAKFGGSSIYGDELVHDQPFTKMVEHPGMQATDYANWWPASGSDNIMGRVQFYQVGIGDVTFSSIN